MGQHGNAVVELGLWVRLMSICAEQSTSEVQRKGAASWPSRLSQGLRCSQGPGLLCCPAQPSLASQLLSLPHHGDILSRKGRRRGCLPVPSPTSKELSQKLSWWLLVASLKARTFSLQGRFVSAKRAALENWKCRSKECARKVALVLCSLCRPLSPEVSPRPSQAFAQHIPPSSVLPSSLPSA